MVIKSSFLRKFLKYAVPFLFIPVCVLLGVLFWTKNATFLFLLR
jgi:hypothetical protein